MPITPEIICTSGQLENNHSLRFQFQQQTGILVRHQGQAYAYINTCPHRKKPLAEGDDFLDNDSLFIRCEHHQALFAMDTGTCITGPCIQQHLTSIAISEQDGHILLLSWPRQIDV
jgi:nitrite reductase/ring-hydroxylating ferredoxin subunit